MMDAMEIDYAALGQEVVTTGKLQELRKELGLSLTAMADLTGVNLLTYRKWESRPETRLWSSTASRLGRFYTAATRQLEVLSEAGVKMSELIPFHEVAAVRGLTQEGLLHQHRAGEIEGVDLGILGLWLPRKGTNDQSASLTQRLGHLDAGRQEDSGQGPPRP